MQRTQLFVILSSLMLMATSSTCATAQQNEPGIKVGDEAPEFKLKDQDGEERALADLLKEKPTALIFHRSANW